MKKYIFITVLVFAFQNANAQADKTDSMTFKNERGVSYDQPWTARAAGEDSSTVDSALKAVDVQSKFAGGDQTFLKFIMDNFQYPVRCQEEGITGYVMLRFVVDTKGRISQISATEETKSCPEFTLEAIRVLKSSPPWIPGQVNGKFVKSWRSLPIRLSLE